jgi:hypothetical protein
MTESLETESPDSTTVDPAEQLRATLPSKDVLEQVAEISLHVLREKGATAPSKKLVAQEIWDRATDLALPFGGEKNTFHAYLSRVVKEADYPIASTGRGRGGGYYLSTLAQSVAQQVGDRAPPEPGDSPTGEAALYPVLQEWLLARGYKARTTASMRALGKWSNPDVTGLSVTEHLGRLELEIATVEAKVSLAQWEYWFFEAVAHRRFANRAFFAFPMPEELADKAPRQLRYMCELYHVGALAIVMEDNAFAELQQGKLSKTLTLEDVTVHELSGAPWTRVSLEYQKLFCKALDIEDLSALFRWGAGA